MHGVSNLYSVSCTIIARQGLASILRFLSVEWSSKLLGFSSNFRTYFQNYHVLCIADLPLQCLIWENIQKSIRTWGNNSCMRLSQMPRTCPASSSSPDANGQSAKDYIHQFPKMPPLEQHSFCWLSQAYETTSQMWITATKTSPDDIHFMDTNSTVLPTS